LAEAVPDNAKLFNSSKACESACQAAVVALPPLPDFDAFSKSCSMSLMPKDAGLVEGVAMQERMVSTVLAAAGACDTISDQPERQEEEIITAIRDYTDFTSNPKCPDGWKEVTKKPCLLSYIPFVQLSCHNLVCATTAPHPW
jgi:hypothetical protein